ncbi:MAG: cyclodeaminase/cyclohydrolase family protein [Nitrospirota bacterium]
MYIDQPMRHFLDKLSSKSPEPGGGSAAALVGAEGAALVGMVCYLTLGKEKYADVQADILDLKDSSESVRADLMRLLQEDTEAFAEASAAYKLPKDTDAQRAEREKKIQSGLIKATEVPFAIGERSLDVARMSLGAAIKGNKGAVSDAGVAVLFAEAAVQAAALNVRINLVSIKDAAYVSDKWARMQEMIKEAGELKEKVVKITYDKIG